jgi:cobalt-precorrin 5A hydrolase
MMSDQTEREKFAVVAITKQGVQFARKIQDVFQCAELYYVSKFAQGDEEERHIHLFNGSVRQILPALFSSYQQLVFVMALGAVVRLSAPLLKDKKTDPGVIVMDEGGKYVISVLSGHLGGANALTRHLAEGLGACPVITTASDVQQTIAADLFGRQFGWEIERGEKLTAVSASLVNQEKAAIVQESGEKQWWGHETAIPANIFQYTTIAEASAANPQAALIVTHRQLSKKEEAILENGILYRPKVIVLGIGCNRGTSTEELEQVIAETLQELQFSSHSVKALCTIELKKDELCILEVIQKFGWEFVCYSADQLNQVQIEEPSETVYKYTGAYGVSEPAAKLYSGAKSLCLTKKKSGNVTISVGILYFSRSNQGGS